MFMAFTGQQGCTLAAVPQHWPRPMSISEVMHRVAPATRAFKRTTDAKAARPLTHNCSLSINGKPGGGLDYALLECDSIMDGGGPVRIGYNSTYMGPFASNFTGVTADPMGCHSVPDEQGAEGDPGGADLCMLTFCGAKDSISIYRLIVLGVEIAPRMAVVCVTSSVHMYLVEPALIENRAKSHPLPGNPGSAVIRISNHLAEAPAVVVVKYCFMVDNRNITGIDAKGGAMLAVQSCRVIKRNSRFSALGVTSTAVAFHNCQVEIRDPSPGDKNRPGVVPLINVYGVGNLSVHNCTFTAVGILGPGMTAISVSTEAWVDMSNNTFGWKVLHDVRGGILVIRNSSFINIYYRLALFDIGGAALMVAFDNRFVGGRYPAGRPPEVIVGRQNSTILLMHSQVIQGRLEARENCSIFIMNCSFLGSQFFSGMYSTQALLLRDMALGVVASSTFKGHMINLGGLGGAVTARSGSCLLICNGSRFISNRAPYGSGGALAVMDNASVVLDGAHFENNTADLDGGAVFVGGPGAVVNITGRTEFTSNSAEGSGADVKANSNLILGDSNINIRSPTVSWMRTDCIVGEFRPDGSMCKTCMATTYSLADANTGGTKNICQLCPPNAKCSGGFKIAPHEGFWRSSERSTQIHSCPRSASCGEGTGNCSTGYKGNLCGKCIREDDFGSTGPFRCALCLSTWKIILIYLSVAIVLVLFLMILVHITIGDSTVSGGRCSTARPSAFLKIAVRHLQYLVIIGSVRVGWPQSIAAVSSGIALVFPSAPQAIFSLDCVYSSYGVLPQAVKPLLTGLIAPVLMLLVVLVGSFLIWKFAGADSVAIAAAGVGTGSAIATDTAAAADQNTDAVSHTGATVHAGRHSSALQGLRSWLVLRAPLSHVAIVSFLVVLFFFYPGLVSTALSLFACLKIDDVSPTSEDPFRSYAIANASYGYWVYDIEQECWEGWHLKWALALGLPCMLLFCFGVPLGTWFALRGVGRAASLSEGASNPLSFLYDNYRVERYYWEVVSTVQIALVAALSVFSITIGAYFTMLLLSLAVVVSWALQVLFKPFAFVEVHVTRLLSLGTLYITASIALTFLSRDHVLPWAYEVATGVVVLLLNALFYIWCTYQIIIHSKGIVASAWEKVQGVFGCSKGADEGSATASQGDEHEGDEVDACGVASGSLLQVRVEGESTSVCTGTTSSSRLRRLNARRPLSHSLQLAAYDPAQT